MDDHRHIIIQRNIEKSDDALEAAEITLINSNLTSSLNRIYYAMFYTVTALARKHDFITSRHKSLIGWFNQTCVHEKKIFDNSLARLFKESFLRRQEHDYEDIKDLPSAEEVKYYLSKAKDFIETVRKEI